MEAGETPALRSRALGQRANEQERSREALGALSINLLVRKVG